MENLQVFNLNLVKSMRVLTVEIIPSSTAKDLDAVSSVNEEKSLELSNRGESIVIMALLLVSQKTWNSYIVTFSGTYWDIA